MSGVWGVPQPLGHVYKKAGQPQFDIPNLLESESRMGAGNRMSMLCHGEAIGHGLHNRLLQCAATAQIQRRIAAERGRTGLLENSKDGGLKHLTTTNHPDHIFDVPRASCLQLVVGQ